MVKTLRKRTIFNLLGLAIVLVWIVLMGMQIKKVSYSGGEGRKIDENDLMTIDDVLREWKEIYLKGKKVGYSVSIIRPIEEGYYLQEEIFLKLNLMGFEKGLYTITYSNVDKNFFLKNFYFKMNSGVVNYEISGSVEGEYILIKTGRGRRKRTERIKLLEPPMISAGMGHIFKTLNPNVGDTFRLPFFDPSTMAQKEAEFKVSAKESININKTDYEAFRVETNIWGALLTFWIDQEGTVLREEGFMGLVMEKSSAANARMNIETGDEEDFYELTAVQADRELPNPGRLGYLKLKIEGHDESVILPGSMDGGRQKFSNGVMEIFRERVPLKASYSIPYDEANNELNDFLKAEFNIESDVSEIRDKAAQIAGKERDPISVTGKLSNWVYNNLEKKPVLSIPSALEVLRTKVGDCNEHATLLTALLRASGIPARINIGLVYNRGKFFYHAWTEAYVGEWISMDATLNQMPADVSHILLMQGNLERQVEIMGLIGKLKIEVLDYEYD